MTCDISLKIHHITFVNKHYHCHFHCDCNKYSLYFSFGWRQSRLKWIYIDFVRVVELDKIKMIKYLVTCQLIRMSHFSEFHLFHIEFLLRKIRTKIVPTTFTIGIVKRDCHTSVADAKLNGRLCVVSALTEHRRHFKQFTLLSVISIQIVKRTRKKKKWNQNNNYFQCFRFEIFYNLGIMMSVCINANE